MTHDPYALFDAWFAEARAGELNDPDAMALATADAQGRPSVRMVLLKGRDERGFMFHSNFDSRKGRELAENPHAALLFHWKSLRRQVRITGMVTRASSEESDAYFRTRPRERQLGAWASDQSRPLASREAFEARYQVIRDRYQDQDVPRPQHWGGFRLAPDQIEFWNDRKHRLHERRLFTRDGERWTEGLLYP